MVLGDNVEDSLGAGRFGLLLLTATLAGELIHGLGSPDPTIPCVGASGGISGVIAYYALRFPRAKLGFLIYFRWVSIPAWACFIMWVLLQIIGALQQVSGVSAVSSLAHLGGAVVGMLFYMKYSED